MGSPICVFIRLCRNIYERTVVKGLTEASMRERLSIADNSILFLTLGNKAVIYSRIEDHALGQVIRNVHWDRKSPSEYKIG